MALIMSLSVTSFADSISLSQQSYIKNTIKGSGSSSTESGPSTVDVNSTGPSAKDVAATGDTENIVMPDIKSYLTNYAIMYLDAEKNLSVRGSTRPSENTIYRTRGYAFHGSRVIALAEQDGFYCVQYWTAENEHQTAWFPARYISEQYPGATGYAEASRDHRNVYVGDATVKWSKDTFVDTPRRYMLVNEAFENCTGFTLDYQVISRNGATTKEIIGPRTVYVNDGDGWIEVCQFDYTELGPVHIVIQLEEPMTLAAVMTVASCTKPNTFKYRQAVLDAYTA